ncbi:venom acid phosphatase Acph-1-like [Atheta coriaria]|uniref:venom acid phosphatase Acph-1-like n=1 Tax=Dalotia coriaria TaxID=877792 RepID=UPI0031F3DD5B
MFSVPTFILLVLIYFNLDTHASQSSDGVDDVSTLVFTNVLFRHGDRIPDESTVYPNSPYTSSSFAPYNYGDLTIKGQARMFNVGRKLRHRYNDFLGDTYFSNLISSSASNYFRTQMSLQALHAGLFKTNTQNPIPGFFWQAIPYSIYEQQDHLIAVWRTYPQLFYNVTFPQPDDATQEIFDYLQMNSGYSKVSYLEALQISDYTKTSTENGLPLPAWLRPIYPNPLSQMTTQTFGVMAKEYVNLGCGFLLKRLLKMH